MKKIISSLIVLSVALSVSSCTIPWLKKNTTETVVIDETKTPVATTEQPTQPVDIVPSDTPKAIAAGGVYLPYTSTAVAQAQGQVVLFFHANWCPTCVAIHKDIEKNLATLPKDITLLGVNFDDAKDLRVLYGVTEQHTFVQVDNTGKLIKKWRGGSTLVELVGQVKK